MSYNNNQFQDQSERDTSFAGGNTGNTGDYDTDPNLGQQGRQGAGYNDQSGAAGVTGSGTGGFDDYGDQKQRSGFGSGGQDQDTARYGDTGVSGGDYDRDVGATGGRYSSGAGAGARGNNEFDDTTGYGSQGQHQKPGLGSKVMGSLEKMAGKATKNPQMEAQGHERKTGDQF